MKMKMIIFFFSFTICILRSEAVRGIAPQDEAYYKSAIIKCKDGSNKFTISQLNDDFCDCPDGTDEPGTSACPNGRFYCRNAGHSPKIIFSSRVHDSICDCCDGSDESPSLCPNTCWQAGKAARDKLSSKISTFQKGVSLRKLVIQQAKAALAKDHAELSHLKAQEDTLKPLIQQLKHHKDLLDKEEENLRNANKLKDTQNNPLINTDHGDSLNTEDLPSQHDAPEITQEVDVLEKIQEFSKEEADGLEKTQELSKEEADGLKKTQESSKEEDDVPENTSQLSKEEADAAEKTQELSTEDKVPKKTEELSREELGRLVASRWTGEKTGKQTEDAKNEKDHSEDVEDTIKDSQHHDDEDEDDAYASETDDDHHQHYADDDHVEDEPYDDFKEEDPEDSDSSYKYESDTESEYSDMANPSSPSLLEKIQQKFRNILQSFNLFQTPLKQSDAARIRKEYDESTAKLSKIQSRISTLTQKLNNDFGPDKEFYSFYDKCFESKENKYVYKVCPYKQASQEEGHSSTRLGRWDKFEDSYKVMVFSNGDKCWNGPDRSLTVKLRCGLKDEVTDVDEPSRCEYVALLSTPALCFEERLEELQRKLDDMNKNEPQKHDEL